MTSHASLPLSGVRIVEMGTVVLAPYAARLLHEMGATVIKVEAPKGDITRHQGPSRSAGMAALFMSCNRGKKSICLDLRKRDGVEVLHRLLAEADVFLTNLRPRNARNLGISYAEISELNPELIYCAAYGFGEGGEYSGRPAYDDIIQAMSGYASLYQKIEDRPRYSPSIMADKTAALFMVIGIQAALLHRKATGKGQYVEVPMFESMVHYLNVEHQAGYVFDPQEGPAGYLRMVSPQRRPHRTRDGFISVMPHNEKDWQVFFTETGHADLLRDGKLASTENRAKNINFLYDRLAEIMLTRTNAEWFEFLQRHEIPHAPIMQFEELFSDPHLQQVGFWQTAEHPSEGRVRWPRFPVTFGAAGNTPPASHVPAPVLGEHTDEILESLGFSAADRDRLYANEAVTGRGRAAQ